MEVASESIQYEISVPGGDRTRNPTDWEHFERQQEALVIQQAYDSNFITDISLNLLKQETEKEIQDIEVISLANKHLKNIGAIQLCYRLKICLLPSNFISDISPLAGCPSLAKLDLSSNHITSFPSGGFWANFPSLAILLLHDNGLGKLSCIQSLSLAPSLEYLTLYDTPISIRPSYRHHVVNSLVHLKVLDQHVVADEEIIEDANFGGKFRALCPNFRVNMTQRHDSNSDISAAEVTAIRGLIRETNRIQAKFSPVIIIQKCIRGYFARKFIKYLIENRIWVKSDSALEKKEVAQAPTVEVQAPEIPEEKAEEEESAPEQPVLKPVQHVRFQSDQLPVTDPQVPVDDPERSQERSQLKVKGTLTLDVDNTTVSLKTPRAPFSTPKEKSKKPLVATPDQSSAATVIPAFSSLTEKQQRQIQEMFETVDPEDVRPFVNQLISSSSNYDWLAIASEAHHGKDSKMRPGIPQVSRGKELKLIDQDEGDDEDEEHTKFRLSGMKMEITYGDPVKENILSKTEDGEWIRKMHAKYHKDKAREPKPTHPRYAFTTLDQLIYGRTKGCMSLNTFLAVDAAYRAKEKEDQVVARKEEVEKMRATKQSAKSKSKKRLQERSKEFVALQSYDYTVTRAQQKERAKYYAAVTEKYRENGFERENQHRRRMESVRFAREFASHCTSVTNALHKHDLKVHREERLQHQVNTVQQLQDRREEQKAIIRKYVTQRQKLLQASSQAERAEIEVKIAQEAKARELAVRDRVNDLKAVRTEYHELYPVPLHIHVGNRTATARDNLRSPKSPLARLAERKILTNQSYDVIHQRVRSAGSCSHLGHTCSHLGQSSVSAAPAVVHIRLKQDSAKT